MTSDQFVVSVPDVALRDALVRRQHDVDVVLWDMTARAPLDKIDLVVPPYMGAVRLLAQLEHVATQLVQGQSLGFDGVAQALPPGVVYANAAGVHETSTSELALTLVLASQRGLADFVRAASRGEWAHASYPGLADRTVLLVGYGGVGQAIEARLAPFEVTIARVASRARLDERGEIHGVESLPQLLPRADVVIVVVPLNESTTGFVDDAFFSLMHDDALFVNVSRGRVVDAEALVAHARRGRLRFALDVTDPEPLPPGHELFGLDNVLISPHVGGATNAMLPRMAKLVDEQVERLLRGYEPLNVVLRS